MCGLQLVEALRSLRPRYAGFLEAWSSLLRRQHVKVLLAGRDVTLVSWSLMLHTVLDAAVDLAASGIDAEVVELRTLQPLDTDAILTSVRKTGRLVIVHEAPVTAGPGAEISAFVAEHGFAHLRGPIRRVGGRDVPMPPSAELERLVIPSKEAVCEAVRAVMRQ